MIRLFEKSMISALALIIVSGSQFPEKRTDVADTATSDRTFSGYLFGRPTDKQIRSWPHKCDSLRAQWGFSLKPGIYKTKKRMRTIEDMELAFVENKNLELRDSIIFWKLSEYMPNSEYKLSEYVRFYLLDIQIQNLLDYDPESQVEMNDWFGMQLAFKKAKTRELFRRLVQSVDGDVAQMLRKEEAQFEVYNNAMVKCYNTVCGDPSFNAGSVSIMDELQVQYDDYAIRDQSLESVYFKIKDGKDYEYEIHKQFPISLIEKEYDDWINSLKENDWAYPLEERRECLLEDKREFLNWMDVREQTSEIMSGEAKEAFDNATNTIRKGKLRMLKNRYLGYGFGSEELFNSILPSTCEDYEVLRFELPEQFK